MRDVSSKIRTRRRARARAVVRMAKETLDRVRRGDVPKGDPLPVAKVAAIQAAKETSRILPYCHPVRIDFVGVDFELRDAEVVVTTEVKANDRTGVEMEALTAASVAALTLYDMLKMIDDDLAIGEVTLLEKSGGKSDFAARPEGLRAGVLVISDTVASGKKADRSGAAIRERLEALGLAVDDLGAVPDDPEELRRVVVDAVEERKLDLVVTTGGTGIGPRDRTPEAIRDLLDREVPGIAEAIRGFGQERIPWSMLSRSVAGVCGESLVLALPGSLGGVTDAMDAVFPWALHALHVVRGGGH